MPAVQRRRPGAGVHVQDELRLPDVRGEAVSVRERRNRKDRQAKTADQLRAAAPVPWPPPAHLAKTPLTGMGYLRAVHYALNGQTVSREELSAYFRSLDAR
jgi:hypothetical protein